MGNLYEKVERNLDNYLSNNTFPNRKRHILKEASGIATYLSIKTAM